MAVPCSDYSAVMPMPSFSPVSYTHLDVYKRQEEKHLEAEEYDLYDPYG